MSLREHFNGQFQIGVAMDGWLPRDYSAAELNLLGTQFATLTPANCMKMTYLQPEEGQFQFGMGDALVVYAATNNIKVCGHCLVWAKDERTPEWFFRAGDKPVSRELLLRRMRQHIEAVAGHYRGKVISWDVVNEALDDGKDFIRPSKWYSIAGEDFIAESFKLARATDPNAILIYNDYNIELPAKREKLLRLLAGLREKQAPIDAVGIQGHWEIDAVPFKDIEDTIVAISKLGLKVMVTEFDIDAIPRARWWADGGKYRDEMSRLNPYKDGCPPEVLERQADQYAKIFAIFRRHSSAIARVTFWDLHDGRSWLNYFPWRRDNHPLLFDRSTAPKPAFHAIVNSPGSP